MKKQFALFLLALLPLIASAQVERTIDVATAGSLSNYISDDEKYQIEKLTLSGELNGTDIHFIRDMAGIDTDLTHRDGLAHIGEGKTEGRLRVLDLSDARIVEGGRDYFKWIISDEPSIVYTDISYTATDEISSYMFAYCYTLEELTLPRSAKVISCDLLGTSLYYSNNLKSLKVADGNPYYDSRDNCNAIIETNTNVFVCGIRTSTIPNSIKSIGEKAFSACSETNSITIPNSVTSIGNYAFYYCRGLTSIKSEIEEPFNINVEVFSWDTYTNATLNVPEGTKSLYQSKEGWNNFQNIVDNQNIVEKRTIYVANAGTLSDYISEDEKYQIVDLTLTGEINGRDFMLLREMAGQKAFVDKDRERMSPTNGKLSKLDISGTKILDGGLYLEFDDGIDNYVPISLIGDDVIPSFVFSYCSGLSSISIPNSVYIIGMEAFRGTTWINNQPNGLVYLGNVLYAYNGTMTETDITVKDGTLGISGSAFSGRTELTSISIPNSVISIGGGESYANRLYVFDHDYFPPIGAFSGCTGITSIDIPSSVKEIGSRAFMGCTGLTSIVIPGSVKEIREDTFKSCTGLSSIVIPGSVKKIGSFAFGYCTGLTSITSEISEPFDIDEHVFYSNNDYIYENVSLIVPKGTKATYESLWGWKRFKNIIEADDSGIESVKNETANNNWYNLQGQRVENPTNGLYIKNGRKVVIK